MVFAKRPVGYFEDGERDVKQMIVLSIVCKVINVTL